MKYYDISRSFTPGMATWPGDTATAYESVMAIRGGASINVSRFTTSTHSGTHIDAPLHFNDQEIAIDQIGVDPFWGLAQVVSITKESGPLFPGDLSNCNLAAAKRIIIKTACSHASEYDFPDQIVYPSIKLVGYLAQFGILLFGTDAPSVDALDDPQLPAHHAFHQHQIAILEGLALKDVPDGVYELAALPLKIQDADGAPCRAVLRVIGP